MRRRDIRLKQKACTVEVAIRVFYDLGNRFTAHAGNDHCVYASIECARAVANATAKTAKRTSLIFMR